jgi:hypothetical protein
MNITIFYANIRVFMNFLYKSCCLPPVSGDLGLGESAQISLSSNDTSVDTAFTESDSEETVFTPSWAPRVGDDPVVGTIFVTPTDDLDGMTTESRSTLVSIDTTSIRHEILVDGETSFDGSVLEDVGLDGGGVRELHNRSLNSVVVLDGGTISTLGEVLALDGLSTVGRSVWEAAISDETVADDEPPGEEGNTTVASVVHDVVAREEVLGRKDDVDARVGGNAESVGEDFRSSEGPATSAVTLISDGVDTSGPLCRGVERGGDILNTFVVEDSQVLVLRVVNEVGTQELLLDLSISHSLEFLGDSSSPLSETVQVVDEFLRDDLVLTNDDGVHSSSDPVAQISVVLGVISSNAIVDFMDDFNVVDQEALSDVVKESFRGGESLGEVDELLDITRSGSADLSSVGDDLSGFTEEGNTFLDLSGVLGLDVSNTGGNILNNDISISDAGLDFVEDAFAGDTGEETSGEVEDISLGILDGLLSDEDGVHSSTDPVAEVGEISRLVSLDSTADLLEDIDSVNEDALANIVQERGGALEGLNHLEEGLDISTGDLALLDSSGDDFDSLADEGNTFLDLRGNLSLDIFNTSDDVDDNSLVVANAGLDVVKDVGGTNTVKETLDEVQDVGSVISVSFVAIGVLHVFIDSESQVLVTLGKRASNEEDKG